MKNVLIYVSPKKCFDTETAVLAKIQIDNSLELGWKKEDIWIFTNFPYEYRGVKAKLVPNNYFVPFRPLSTKTVTVASLLPKWEDDLYWIHDFDAYQAEQFDDLDGEFLLTDYGWSKKWCLGSYFVSPKAQDIMTLLKQTIYEYEKEDERALVQLTENKSISGLKKINITYNFGMRNIAHNYTITEKPIKVLHFHPWRRGRSVLKSFMYGKNELEIPLMTERLIKIFQKNGIQ